MPDSIEWVQLRDGNAGKTYYWNRRTRATVWKAPSGVKVVWVGERPEEGEVCNWHKDTRVSTFDLPPAAYVPVTMQRQVPAVLRVRHPSDCVHRQSVGHSCYATEDRAQDLRHLGRYGPEGLR